MSKRYTEYGDSGVAGPGAVPAGWTTTRLKHVSTVQTGITLSGEGDLADPEWPYLRVANVQVGYVDLHEIKTVRVPADKAAASLLQPGDVLMTEGGDVDKLGRGALWRGELPDMLHQNHIFAVRPSEVLDSEFLVYWLDSPVARTYFRTTAKQTTNLAGTNKSTLGNLPIPMPLLKDQRAIADYLDRETARVDTLIEEQQRLIEILLERRAAVISTALTPTDSWARRRIKHIGETSLGKMLDAGRVVRDGDEPRPYVRAADVRADGSVNLVDLNEMPFSEAEMSVFDLRAGDVLLIEGGATVGRPGFLWEPAPGIAFQKTVNRLRVGPQVDARFVYWSMLRLYESAHYANHYGAVSFVHLTGEKLREIELHLPSVDEQRAIVAYLDEQTAKIGALIAETDRFIDLSRERRSALVTAAVTGQIDVRGMV